MAIWVKKDGIELELNDHKDTIAAAKANGWTQKGKEVKKEVKKKTKD